MATTGPGRPQNKSASTGEEDPADLEKSLEDATVGVVESAKNNSNLIILVVLGIVALLALPSMLERVEEQKLQKMNNDIDTCLSQTSEQILESYSQLLSELQGTPVEAYAYSRVTSWMWSQQDESLWDTVVELLEQAQSKFPDDMLISARIVEYSTAIASSKSFTLPEIPEEPVVIEETVTEPDFVITEEIPEDLQKNDAEEAAGGTSEEPTAEDSGAEGSDTGGSDTGGSDTGAEASGEEAGGSGR